MSEEDYNRQRRKRRQYQWIFIFFLIASVITGNIVLFPNPLPHPEYVPTIANGLVAAMSILMALAFFSASQLHVTIHDKIERWNHHLLAMIYFGILLVILFLGIVLGYSLILYELYGFALNTLIIALVLIVGIIMDMWLVGDRYSFK